MKLISKPGSSRTNYKLLTEGDHFGEISLLYDTERSATVIARNYNTIAHLTYDHFRLITRRFPELKNLLHYYATKYDDPTKKFL